MPVPLPTEGTLTQVPLSIGGLLMPVLLDACFNARPAAEAFREIAARSEIKPRRLPSSTLLFSSFTASAISRSASLNLFIAEESICEMALNPFIKLLNDGSFTLLRPLIDSASLVRTVKFSPFISASVCFSFPSRVDIAFSDLLLAARRSKEEARPFSAEAASWPSDIIFSDRLSISVLMCRDLLCFFVCAFFGPCPDAGLEPCQVCRARFLFLTLDVLKQNWNWLTRIFRLLGE